MQTSVYQINKGINKPVQFKGLKAQYIWYLGGALLALLVLFAILFICGVNTFICLGIILALGACVVSYVYKLSNKYGEYGMLRNMAKRSIPATVKSYSRKEFTGLKK
ncbi:DUF4133 domain-containing protein [Longitalea arenae]|uniref:DUF4133 domain-containing protein n=1 Tax=Longitalea arenae TaxID=2812558 RepID=UPI00196718B0|nr:DUF4133 domain-containing protein [Longitalea arenae]